MFKIVAPTKFLVKFPLLLKLRLSEPHNAISRTLSRRCWLAMARKPSPSSTVFFTYSPWDNNELRRASLEALVRWVLEENQHALIPDAITIVRAQKGEHIPFKSKLTLAKEILKEPAPLPPKELPVYVLFDSWYASKRLIKLCRRLGWHVICALKHNRKFRKTGATKTRRLSQLARYMSTTSI